MHARKSAIITGIAGQDGMHLAKLLSTKEYNMIGIAKNLKNEVDLKKLGVKVINLDICDTPKIMQVIEKYKPDEFYNFAAISSVSKSWHFNSQLMNTNALAVEKILENILKYEKSNKSKVKFYQASSSEIFGPDGEQNKNEKSKIAPVSPYGASKAYAHMITNIYRETYNIYAVSGILFNHESVLRDSSYVTRKITEGVAKIKLGLIDSIALGNINIERDWGFAGDYIQAIWSMMQQEQPENLVIATGISHTIRELLEFVFELAEIKNFENYVTTRNEFVRPLEGSSFIGDSKQARTKLNWSPKKNIFNVLQEMYNLDLQLAAKK